MDSLKLADFLFARIQETIDYKQYIEEVHIDYGHAQTYGNEYLQISYMVIGNQSFNDLGYNEQERMFRKTSNYTFSLSTNKEHKYSEKKMLIRFIEFRHIYESLTSYAVLQLEKYLNHETPIKVKGIDFWPQANYAEKYLFLGLHGRYSKIMHSDFENDVSQWSRLHQLAKESQKICRKEKGKFNVTDIEINNLFELEFDKIRYILLNNEIPIKIIGIRTVDEIRIHSAKLVEALKREINDDGYVRTYRLDLYKRLIDYLYDNYLVSEKIKIINFQQSEFLKHFIIQKGDILQLIDMRIVMANSTSIDSKNEIKVEYVILKTNLDPGQRGRVIGTGDILYILKNQDFSEFISKNSIRHLSLLNRWMSKRKVKFNFASFELDLIKKMDNAI